MKNIVLGLVLVPVLWLASCTPIVAPTPAATGTKAPASTPAATANTPVKMNPEEAEWNKVVEAAKKEGKVTFYASAYAGETITLVRNAFKERYGIDVDIITGRGAEFTERLKTERRIGSMVGDLVQTSTVNIMAMKNVDLLESSKGLPILSNKGDFRVDPLLDKDGYILIYLIFQVGPQINTNVIKPREEPKSWQELLGPKWKGKMLASSPLISTGLYLALIPLLNSKALTLDQIREFGSQDLVFARGDQETAEKLSRGEYPMTLHLSDLYAAPYVKEGALLKAIPMAEGYSASTSTLAQIKGAPHPNATKVFLNWTLSSEGQTVYHKSRSTVSVRKDVSDFRPPSLALPANAKIVYETVADIEDESKKFTDRWLTELWKK